MLHHPNSGGHSHYTRGSLAHHFSIWLIGAILFVTVWWHVFGLIEGDRMRTQAAVESDISNLARVSEEHAERTFASLDQALRLLQFEYASKGQQLNLQAMNAAALFDSRILLQVGVIDAQGLLQQSTVPFTGRIDLSDREHFKVHTQAAYDTLYISRPILGRASGKLSIQLSRRLVDKDGAFAGVVVASMDPAYFTRFYSELHLGARGVATVFGLDGVVRARRVGNQDPFEGDLAASPLFTAVTNGHQSGTYSSTDALDGAERILHFRKLAAYPIVVAIGADTEGAFSNHEHSASSLLGQAALASIFLFTIAAATSWYLVQRRHHHLEQKQALSLLRELTSRVPGAVYQFLMRRDGRTSYPFVSAGFRTIYRLGPAGDLIDASHVLALIHPEDLPQRVASFEHSAKTLSPWEQEYRVRFADGTVRWLFGKAAPQPLNDGSLMWHGYVSDITERKLAEAQLRIAATAFESHEGMFICDSAGTLLRVNRAFSEITGYSADEAVGKTPSLLRSGRHDPAFYAAMRASIAVAGSWQGEIWNRRKNGEVFPEWLTVSAVKDDKNTVTHYVSTFADITSRKVAEDQIKNLAFYDPLTGLPNRRLLMDRLRQALASNKPYHRNGALLFIDLDNFKILNDTQGHGQGDAMLRQAADRLNFCVRSGDTVARLGSDEFVVMLQDLNSDSNDAGNQAQTVGEQIVATLSQPYQLFEFTHHSSASVGVALFHASGFLLEDLLKRADLALDKAKQAGGNTLRFFDPEMQDSMTARAQMEADLRQGLANNQFLLYYQPQVDHQDCLTGAEALVRWVHPQRGLVSPAHFIPLAEETRLILPLGQWVLETACQQLRAWSTQVQTAHLTISVNVSALQFLSEHFVDDVLSTIARTKAPAHRLKLELTESLLVNDVANVITKMVALKESGLGFSLDDFGTGYSSLSYLKRLPLDQLKIDQSFLHEALSNPKDAAIVRATVTLGASLGMMVIAEGVETLDQRAFLEAEGCHHFQGYLFGRPGPVGDLQRFFAEPGVARA